MTDYAAKVAAGIKLLDSKKPGWRSKIEADDLNLGSCDVCVLGQVFGSYDSGLADLGLDTYDAKSYGFNTSYDFQELTDAWKDALVEKGDIYKDVHGYAVKVVQTLILTVDGKTITTYLVQTGNVTTSGSFKTYDEKHITALQKSDFEKTYKTKVEKFVPKRGMFVTNKAGQNFYMVSDDEMRELKDGAYAVWINDVDTTGLREMLTGMGKRFSDTIVK
jgi:hypothetical protein